MNNQLTGGKYIATAIFRKHATNSLNQFLKLGDAHGPLGFRTHPLHRASVWLLRVARGRRRQAALFHQCREWQRGWRKAQKASACRDKTKARRLTTLERSAENINREGSNSWQSLLRRAGKRPMRSRAWWTIPRIVRKPSRT